MASFLDVQWDGAEVGRLLVKKATRYNKDISEMMKAEMRTMANTAAQVLPPFQKGNFSSPSYARSKPIGERRVRQGYDITYPTPKGEEVRGGDKPYTSPGAYKGIAKVAGEEVARVFYGILYKRGEKPALEFLRQRGVPVSLPDKRKHDSVRVGRSKGHPGRSDFIAVSPTRGRVSKIKGSKDRVGRLKAAYSISASQLGLKTIPKWVSRHHSLKEGRVNVSQLYTPWNQSIEAIPYAQYAPDGSKRLVDLALSFRQKKLQNEVSRVERKARGYFNRR